MFSKKLWHQLRDIIKIQKLIHLNSNAMKTISGSNYETKLSSLGEINVFCYFTEIYFVLVDVWKYINVVPRSTGNTNGETDN